ncbi:hypothetical protein HMPREF9336_02495 [Segniliparus rugosus ATCC BAA-974]|uniref:DUF3000 domain-containing protein n=2 Tax=Segniliparus rugosus TaxID=286804 RepID=E5XSM3_SEGRC|nr:hypothetical protein HMPREF9336_02495 [Segniliparus rugosus ATCC BAA-974]
MREARHRPEISLGPIRPPGRLAPYSYALGAEISGDPDSPSSVGEAFGRLILLYDPEGAEVWQSVFRLVAYVQAELDDEIAGDPLLPEVAWSWLTEALASEDTEHVALGGTVTSVASIRYGDIAGPTRSHQLELRASWTPVGENFAANVEAFCSVLEAASGLPPVGVAELRPGQR